MESWLVPLILFIKVATFLWNVKPTEQEFYLWILWMSYYYFFLSQASVIYKMKELKVLINLIYRMIESDNLIVKQKQPEIKLLLFFNFFLFCTPTLISVISPKDLCKCY